MEVKKSEILFDTIRRLARRNAWSHIRRLLLKSHPADIAGVIRQMTDADAVNLICEIRNCSIEAKTFCELGSRFLGTYLELKDDKVHVAEMLQSLPEDEAAALLADFDDDLKNEILALMHVGTQAEVNELLEYDEGTCGRIMAVNVFALNQKLTAREAIDAIQQTNTPESLFYIYVIDDYENLVGVVSLRQLLQASKMLTLAHFMATDLVRVTAYQSQEEAANFIEEYNYVCLPVVNENGKLIGMVTVDDIIDFIRDEAQDEVLQMAGVEKEAIEDFSFGRAFVSRGFWYFMLFLGGILASELILLFFSTIPGAIRHLVFAPLVLRLGDSIATQTSTFFQQSVLSENIEREHALRAFWGQNLVTAEVALLISVLTFFYSWLRVSFNAQAALGVMMGILVLTFLALLLGVFIPFVFHKLRLDPLKLSSRFFHFAMDLLSLLIFFNFLWLWQRYV